MRITDQAKGGPTNVSVMRHISDRRVTGPVTNEWPRSVRSGRTGWSRSTAGIEGSSVFNPLEFTGLHVQSSTLKNRLKTRVRLHDHAVVSRLAAAPRAVPAQGLLGHAIQGPGRDTKLSGRRRAVPRKHRGLRQPREQGRHRQGLSCREPYINNESIQNTENTVWLVSTLLHTFRDEDGTFATPSRTFWGTASTMWTGFDMKPHNLFDGAPFFRRCRRRVDDPLRRIRAASWQAATRVINRLAAAGG